MVRVRNFSKILASILIVFLGFSNLILVVSVPLEVDFTRVKKYTSPSEPSELKFMNIATYIDYDLTNNNKDQMIINLCLGTPTQCFNVLVDSGSFYLWVADKNSWQTPDATNKFDKTKSSTYQSNNVSKDLQYGSGSTSGILASETLTIGSLKATDYNFLLASKEENMKDIDGILGLGYYYDILDSPKFSMLDQLKASKMINSRLFTQKYTEQGKGKLYIGDLPDEITNDMTNYGKCKSVKSYSGTSFKNPYWQCTLKTVFFGDITSFPVSKTSSGQQKYSVTAPAAINEACLFDTGTNIMTGPSDFVKSLKYSYLKNAINQLICTYNGDYGYSLYICDKRAFDILPNMHFVFDDWALELTSNDLLKEIPGYAGQYQFMIMSTSTVKDWIIGEPVLKKFHIVFNKDADEIGFYSLKNKNRVEVSYPIAPSPSPYIPDPSPYDPYPSPSKDHPATPTDDKLWLWFVIGGAILAAVIIIIAVICCKKSQRQVTQDTPNYYSINNRNPTSL
jgi:hypothetical protein